MEMGTYRDTYTHTWTYTCTHMLHIAQKNLNVAELYEMHMFLHHNHGAYGTAKKDSLSHEKKEGQININTYK
jgi:hypothetical protein